MNFKQKGGNAMSTNFDEIIDRHNTNSLKYDFSKERNRPEDLLPLWVADMDFKIAAPILDDIHEAVNHGIFGYSEVKGDYFKPLHQWFLKQFHWNTRPEWLIKTPGIVYAISIAIQAYTNIGDAIMLQQPVYYPFMECIIKNKRRLVNNQLIYNNNQYSIDFQDFENKIVNENVKIFLLCSPHNPVGRVWTRKELTRIGNICLKHNVIVISDEIHCDFTYEGYYHTVFAALSRNFANNSIICTSPTKTFNIAGLQISNIFIPNEKLRKKFKYALNASGYSQLNTIGLVAAKSAYEKGESWYRDLKVYLKGNLDYLRDFIQTKIPQIKMIEPQGTYLVWLDCSGLGLNHNELEDLVIKKAKLWLDSGSIFGKETQLFQRINIACPRSILKQALTQLETAVHTQ